MAVRRGITGEDFGMVVLPQSYPVNFKVEALHLCPPLPGHCFYLMVNGAPYWEKQLNCNESRHKRLELLLFREYFLTAQEFPRCWNEVQLSVLLAFPS
ncbi:hypothetical protein MDA_GLEAN10017173 [Myotis davidii]|uniref:Uncharacterized protein n=1 Tax=Myotis davidii TaxID=225400 RepID=L5LR43_MYODS|nr:hypothetical protein MDA_GLEAN10017173 [Myotis davidii]